MLTISQLIAEVKTCVAAADVEEKFEIKEQLEGTLFHLEKALHILNCPPDHCICPECDEYTPNALSDCSHCGWDLTR